MRNAPVRYKGKEYSVIDRLRIGGRTYLAIARLGTSGRRAFQVFDTSAKQMRALHILPNSQGTYDRVRTLQRVTRGDNEILQIIECKRQNDAVYVVLPWIDGFNLRSVLNDIRQRKQPRIAAPEAVRLTKGVAHALRHLHHNRQIIHGDIKPANLLLTKRTSLVLIDYGNAWTIERTLQRSEGDGVSGAYTAPELLQDDRSVNFRADVFSLGVVLYELLTGKIPYEGYGGKVAMLPDSVTSGLRLVPASEISPDRNRVAKPFWKHVDELLNQSLAIDPDHRFDTSGAWLDAWSTCMSAMDHARGFHSGSSRIVRFIDWFLQR